MTVRIEHGDMLDVLPRLAAEGVRVHAVVTDPPYHLGPQRTQEIGHSSWNGNTERVRAAAKAGFMGKQWDGGDIAFRPETWRLCWDLLPPGGHLLAFASTRTYHRIACAIEDAGFEIRDCISFLYGSGFPKAHNLKNKPELFCKCGGDAGLRDPSGALDGRALPHGGCCPRCGKLTEAFKGFSTALKPAAEFICFARKPLQGTVAANVLAHGTGALNIDACRIATADDLNGGAYSGEERRRAEYTSADTAFGAVPLSRLNRGVGQFNPPLGRWPANVAHDGSAEVVGAFPDTQSGSGEKSKRNSQWYEGGPLGSISGQSTGGDSGSAARFFKSASFTEDEKRFHYSSKADHGDRLGSGHPTVKPVDLMRWLVRLVTPPGGTVLDCFAGSGSTVMACLAEGFDCIAVEREDEYVADIRRRIAHVSGQDTPLFAEAAD